MNKKNINVSRFFKWKSINWFKKRKNGTKKEKARPIVITLFFILSTLLCYSQRETDTVRVVVLTSDTANIAGKMYVPANHLHATWMFAYSVREKHNTDEGKIDPYHQYGYVSRDYWVHVKYLTIDKKPFPNTVIIWQSVDAKK